MRVKGLFNRLIRKLLNRRQASSRYPVSLKVRTTSATGDDLEAMSEDVSERGIRLRFEDYGIADILGHREEITMEIFLEAEVPPVNVQAKLMWAFAPSGGGAVSGWEFLELKGRSLRRFRTFIDRSDGKNVVEDETE
jgi:hypothetical protein